MSDAEIVSLAGEYMESLAGVDGVNNHQGSRATTDVRACAPGAAFSATDASSSIL
jgi:polysaccharide deacetylase 2 family uncharacterized protein YibQ